MKAKTILQILAITAISLVNMQANAQYTATAVMNVTVEVVDGSSVIMNQNDLISFNEENPTDVIFAIFSISHDQENTILISALDTIQMINGIESVEMTSILTETRDANGLVTLGFSAGGDQNFTGGLYSGNQVAEIVYL
jgi:hypothetical protein